MERFRPIVYAVWLRNDEASSLVSCADNNANKIIIQRQSSSLHCVVVCSAIDTCAYTWPVSVDYGNKQRNGGADWLSVWRTWQVTCSWLDTATVEWFRVELVIECRCIGYCEIAEVMSRLIRFISARWTRRGHGRVTTTTPGGGVPCVSTTTTNERLCCRVSLLDGTDMIVDLPVSHSHNRIPSYK